MGEAGAKPASPIARFGKQQVMKQKILNLLKLAIGIGVFVGIVALTILRLIN